MSILEDIQRQAKEIRDREDAKADELLEEYDDFLREQEAKKDKGLSDEGYFLFKTFGGM